MRLNPQPTSSPPARRRTKHGQHGELKSAPSTPVTERQRSPSQPRKSRQRSGSSKRATPAPARRPFFRYGLIGAAVWLVATVVYYFAFQRDLVTRLMDEQTELQLTYEDRIAELRSRLDRVMSQKMLDQQQVEQRVNALLQWQARISRSLDKAEQKQTATLSDLEERINLRTRRIQTILADLGVKGSRSTGPDATGGPFVPVKPGQTDTSAFETQLNRINASSAQIDRVAQTILTVPLGRPVIGEADMTSPFGMRKHPIFRRMAIHTGIDLRGDTGDPVRATATGKVTIASRQSGYGNMVEISHGNGLATRFGHLSEINVKVGQVVRIGEIIGSIGSTGLSTGPHLHYETRVNGQPVDPQKFLRAGLSLGDD
jgi:murein DD-endopeptidase MepM/ murein hydrolase activator NlpD